MTPGSGPSKENMPSNFSANNTARWRSWIMAALFGLFLRPWSLQPALWRHNAVDESVVYAAPARPQNQFGLDLSLCPSADTAERQFETYNDQTFEMGPRFRYGRLNYRRKIYCRSFCKRTEMTVHFNNIFHKWCSINKCSAWMRL